MTRQEMLKDAFRDQWAFLHNSTVGNVHIADRLAEYQVRNAELTQSLDLKNQEIAQLKEENYSLKREALPG